VYCRTVVLDLPLGPKKPVGVSARAGAVPARIISSGHPYEREGREIGDGRVGCFTFLTIFVVSPPPFYHHIIINTLQYAVYYLLQDPPPSPLDRA
jgi:hypothetical protein